MSTTFGAKEREEVSSTLGACIDNVPVTDTVSCKDNISTQVCPSEETEQCVHVAAVAPENRKKHDTGVRKDNATKLKKSKHNKVSFSEKDNVIIPCSQLYYSFVEQYDSRRYDLDTPRCPPGGEFKLNWGTIAKDSDVALAVAIRKASHLRYEVWRDKVRVKWKSASQIKHELDDCKVPVVWRPDGTCSVYEFWTPFSSGVEFNRAFRRSDMTSEEMSGQTGSYTLGIMSVY